MIIKIAMLLLFFGTMIAIGIYCRKNATDVNGFVLGGRSVGPWLTAFAYGTSYFSAVVFVGYAGQFGWKFGMASTWIGLGNALLGSMLAWFVLGRRTRVMTQHLDSATMPDFFGKRYQSRSIKLVSSAITFVFLVPYTASLYNGLSRLFAMAFDIDYSVCIIIMAALTGIYVIAGGYMATAISDFIQGIIMIVGIVAIIIGVLNVNGGFTQSTVLLSKIEDAASEMSGAFTSFLGPDPISLFGVIILTSLGTWGLPQMVQKFYAIKNEQAISKGSIISTFFAIIVSGGCYFLGGFGRLFLTSEQVAQQGFDAIIPQMLSTLSPFLIALAVVLVMSASMSTLSSLVMASSSTVTIDFIDTVSKKKLSDKRKVFIIRLFVVIFIVVSAAIAIYQYKGGLTFIAQLMSVSWGALAGSFLAPFLYGLYWKKTTKAACWVSFGVGTISMILNILFRPYFPTLLQSPLNLGAFAMILGLILVPAISLISKKPDTQFVEHAFSCYDKTVETTQKKTLGK